MAAGNFTLFNRGKLKYHSGAVLLGSHSFRAMLTGSGQALSATFTGTSTDCRRSDLTAEVTGTGYTANGVTVTLTVTEATGTITVDSTDPQWTGSTITAKYCVWYDDTNVNKDLVGFVDLETGGGGTVSTTNGTLTITVNASGLFTAT